MDRGAGTLALAILAGLLLVGIVWGLLASALALVGVILAAGLAGQAIAGERVRAGWVFPAGLAGSLLALAAVGLLGLPPLVRLAGVPVLWAIVGATAVLVTTSALVRR
ncbi:MAG: hypothetical protein HY264_01615 [Chloroflexi bacterium]|nr:hypothetical protein [Chloroflexota bacterium]